MEHSQVHPESTINLIPKQNKDNFKKKGKLQVNMSDDYGYKNVNKILATWIQQKA